jgi:hypothetical protein
VEAPGEGLGAGAVVAPLGARSPWALGSVNDRQSLDGNGLLSF